MSKLLADPWKNVATLFGFYVVGDYYRYTNWTDDITVGSATYSSVPKMGIETIRRVGGTEPVLSRFSMPANLPPADTLIQTNVHSPVIVLIQECNADDPDELLYLASGRVEIAFRGLQLKTPIVWLEIADVRRHLRGQLGLPFTRTCVWSLGDGGCQKPFSDQGDGKNWIQEETGVIDAIDRDKITVSGLSTLGDRHWFRGHVRIGGARIGIRWYSTGTSMWLRSIPPASWIGQTAIFRPGCDQTPTRCDEWQNLEHFAALGFGVPDWLPVLDAAPQAALG